VPAWCRNQTILNKESEMIQVNDKMILVIISPSPQKDTFYITKVAKVNKKTFRIEHDAEPLKSMLFKNEPAINCFFPVESRFNLTCYLVEYTESSLDKLRRGQSLI
jgi:hypothetical protein